MKLELVSGNYAALHDHLTLPALKVGPFDSQCSSGLEQW
jgi:hypothetical protein